MKAAKRAFVKAGLSDVLTIGTDDCCVRARLLRGNSLHPSEEAERCRCWQGGEYRVVPQMASDPELNASIDILGAHCTVRPTISGDASARNRRSNHDEACP